MNIRSWISTSIDKYDIHSSVFGSTNHLFILFRDVLSVTKLLDGIIMIYCEVRDRFIQETSSPGKWTFLFGDEEY